MERKVAILGTGPSAAFAFRACMDYGLTPDEVLVYGTEEPVMSVSAPVYFHDVPDSVRQDAYEHTVGYIPEGDAQMYMMKQWGKEFAGHPSSFPDQAWKAVAFDPNEVLPMLWSGVVSYSLTSRMQLNDLYRVSRNVQLVFQTFPIWDGVPRRSATRYVVEVSNDIHPQEWLMAYESDVQQSGTLGFFLYAGKPQQAHTRVAIVNRVLWYEFPSEETLPTRFKPVAIPFVDIHPAEDRIAQPHFDNVVLLGRSATWDRRMLAHQAYSTTYTALSANSI